MLVSNDGDEGDRVPALTKAQIAEKLYEKALLSKQESVQIIEALFEIIKQALEQGEDLLISGFGRFCVRQKHKRRGRNPHSGQSLTLPPRKVVTFKCSAKLRERLNWAEEKLPGTGTTRR